MSPSPVDVEVVPLRTNCLYFDTGQQQVQKTKLYPLWLCVTLQWCEHTHLHSAEGWKCEKTQRGNGRGSRQTVTDALPLSEMKSFALMLVLMKRISEVLKFRFEGDPCESLATGGNQSTGSPFSHRLSFHPPICAEALKYITENRTTIRRINLSACHGHEIGYAEWENEIMDYIW